MAFAIVARDIVMALYSYGYIVMAFAIVARDHAQHRTHNTPRLTCAHDAHDIVMAYIVMAI